MSNQDALRQALRQIAEGRVMTGEIIGERPEYTHADTVIAYQKLARAALAAPAQAEPVPVAWQIRRTDGSPLATWEDCTQANYQRTRDSGRYWGFGDGPNAEARALVVQQTSPKGAVPPTAEQIESLRQWFIRNHKFWLTRDSIRAALEDAGIGGAPSVQDAWRAIESAPRDGTRILGWNEAYGMRETKMHLYGEGSPGYAAWKVGKGPREAGWDWSEPKNNWASSWRPSHWQSLPPPPGTPQGDPHD